MCRAWTRTSTLSVPLWLKTLSAVSFGTRSSSSETYNQSYKIFTIEDKSIQIFCIFLATSVIAFREINTSKVITTSCKCTVSDCNLFSSDTFWIPVTLLFEPSPSHILVNCTCIWKQKIPELGQSGLNQSHCDSYCMEAIHSVSNQAWLYPRPLPAPQPNQTHICRQSACNYT